MLSDGGTGVADPDRLDGGARAGLRAAAVAAIVGDLRAAGVVVDRRVVGRRAQLPDREGLAASEHVRGAAGRLVGAVSLAPGSGARRDRRDAGDALVEDATPVGFRSAAASDVGLAREINEDAFVERPEVGRLGGGRRARRAPRRRSRQPHGLRRAGGFGAGPELRGDDRSRPPAPAAGQRAPAPHGRHAPRSPIEAPAPSSCCWCAGMSCADPLGGRQPRLSMAIGPAGAADPRSQRWRTRTDSVAESNPMPSRGPSASSRRWRSICFATRCAPATDSCSARMA